MANLNGFNANDVEPATEFEPVPAGRYLAVVVDSEMKPNKAGTGHYLQLAFQIIEGPYKNRYLWARLNLDNPNATAVQIARAELSAICRATGVLSPSDSCELHHLPLTIRVTLKRRADTGELENVIKGYAKKESPPVTTAQPSANSTPPWKR